jgi:hypothetical protein
MGGVHGLRVRLTLDDRRLHSFTCIIHPTASQSPGLFCSRLARFPERSLSSLLPPFPTVSTLKPELTSSIGSVYAYLVRVWSWTGLTVTSSFPRRNGSRWSKCTSCTATRPPEDLQPTVRYYRHRSATSLSRRPTTMARSSRSRWKRSRWKPEQVRTQKPPQIQKTLVFRLALPGPVLTR